MKKTATLRNGDLIRSIFRRILLPALAAGASANLSGIIDGIIVGNSIGSSALAAVNACRPAMQLYSFFSEIITAGFASCIALSIGRNEKKNADRFFTVGMLSALLTAVVLIAVQLLLLRPLCTLFANDATLYPLTLEYYRIILFSTFFILVCEPIAVAMRMDGNILLSGLVLLLPHILNAIFNVLLINVFHLGLTGAAIATVLGYFFSFLICCYYFFFKKSYHLSGGYTRKHFTDIVSVGSPTALTMGLISIKLFLVNSMSLSAGGPTGMAVMSLLMTAWALQSLFIGGVKQSMMPMTSFYYGNGDYYGVRAVFRHSLRVLLGLMFLLSALLFLFPQVLPLLYGMREAQELACAKTAVRIFAVHLPLEAFVVLVITYYTSIQNKKPAFLLSVLEGLGSMVLVLYPLVHFLGLNGVWLSFLVSDLISLSAILILSRGTSERFFRMKGNTYLKDFSVDRNRIQETVASVRNAVSEAGFDLLTANKTGMAIEDMALSAFERNLGKKIHIDVTVRKTDDQTLLVTFSDNGVEYNPLQADITDEESQLSNIAILRAISEKMEYGRIIGMNKTDITLR